MSMTYEKFVGYALNLKDLSDSIDDGWNICEHLNPMVKLQNIYFIFIYISLL